jgi:hypothetical protein
MRDSAQRRLPVLPLLAALALTASACGGSSSSSPSVTTPTTPVTSSVESFSGEIGQNGTAVHSFAVKNANYTLMAGFTSIGPASVNALGLGIGAWDATTSTCGLNMAQNDAAKSGNTAISGTAGAGNYCVRVYDAGNLPAGVTATYTVQVEHY